MATSKATTTTIMIAVNSAQHDLQVSQRHQQRNPGNKTKKINNNNNPFRLAAAQGATTTLRAIFIGMWQRHDPQ